MRQKDSVIKVVVVDDHALFRAGLVSLLNDMPDVDVIGEANNGKTAIQVVEELKPDVVLLDVNMPVMDGVETVKELKKHSDARIIMLTISKSENDLFSAIKAGADGYLLKNSEPTELNKALNLVREGKAILSPEVTRQVMMVAGNSNANPKIPESILTKREKEVLECLSNGFTTAEIADELFISDNTVKTHVRHLLEKLEASNRAEAVSKATQQGILRQ